MIYYHICIIHIYDISKYIRISLHSDTGFIVLGKLKQKAEIGRTWLVASVKQKNSTL